MTDHKQLQERDPTTGKISKSSLAAVARARAGKAEKARERREKAIGFLARVAYHLTPVQPQRMTAKRRGLSSIRVPIYVHQ